jgi:protein-L-isoaspartate(D-aspartate) O-methyltransferase
MAWISSGRTNVELIHNLACKYHLHFVLKLLNTTLLQWLKAEGVITSSRVKDAMLKVDRRFFAPTSPYTDSPQAIGFGATISAPVISELTKNPKIFSKYFPWILLKHMHAYALQILHDKLIPGASVLDVGSGSGYLTACLWNMVR